MADKTNEQAEQIQEKDVVYFVSFYHSRGFDNTEVTMMGEIFHINQIVEMQEMIENEFEYKNVKIQAFFPLRLGEESVE